MFNQHKNLVTGGEIVGERWRPASLTSPEESGCDKGRFLSYFRVHTLATA